MNFSNPIIPALIIQSEIAIDIFRLICIINFRRRNIKGEKADPWIRVDPRGSA